MTREKDDPEKRNLLNVHREETKKRRHYSGSRSKLDRRSCESSSSEHRKRSASYKISSTDQRPDISNKSKIQAMPFTTEKKDSWWIWQNAASKKEEDSCSCVSCALKRIVSSEYACVGCLLLLFTISIIVAFLVVFKNVPNIGGDCKELDCKKCKAGGTTASLPKACKDCGVADSERLKRKIDMLSSKRMKKRLTGIDEFQKDENKIHDDMIAADVGVPGMPLIDFGPSFRELSSIEESNRKLPFNEADLSTIIYSGKNMDGQSSEKLREFYKKLIQTDAKIKSLKKLNQIDTTYVDDHMKLPKRSRRSLKLYHYPRRFRRLKRQRSVSDRPQKNKRRSNFLGFNFGNQTRLRKLTNETEEPTGFVIEKKKLLVQYSPTGKQRIPVKKCQHAPKDALNAHEKQMMHPFYKNTEKLDELLDKFLNKNLPEIVSDPFGLDEFFKLDKVTKLCKHPKPHKNVNIISPADTQGTQIPKPKSKSNTPKNEPHYQNSNIYKILKPETTSKCEKDFYNQEVKMLENEKKKLVTYSPSEFELLLSVSTIMNPLNKGISKMYVTATTQKNHFLRKLMQFDAGEDEEALGYEDFKEVLTDEIDSHDETEKAVDRNKRDTGELLPEPPKYKSFDPQFTHVQNPNWKCAMPLYPDEINSMMANKDPSKANIPKTTHHKEEESLPNQRRRRDIPADVEYVEDYEANKNDKLVQQAQAYSDYGVLDGKKESRNEKESPTVDSVENNHKVKFAADDDRATLLTKIKGRVVPRNAESISRHKKEAQEHVEKATNIEDAEQNRMLFNSFTNADMSEGLTFKLNPTTNARDDYQATECIKKMVTKHVMIKPTLLKIDHPLPQHYMHTSLLSLPSSEGDNNFNENLSNISANTTSDLKKSDELEDEINFILGLPKGTRRRLLAVGGFDDAHNYRDHQESSEYGKDNKDRNSRSIDKSLQSQNLKANNIGTNEEMSKDYIDNDKSLNIKFFSTPQSHNSPVSSKYSKRDESLTPATLNIDSIIQDVDPVITINKSEVNGISGDNFLGKIILTVKSPSFEEQTLQVAFDVPIDANFETNRFFITNDSSDFSYNHYMKRFTELTIPPEIKNLNSDHKTEDVQTANRYKREASMTANWTEISSTLAYLKDYEVIENDESDKQIIVTIVTPRTSTTGEKNVKLKPTTTSKTAHSNINSNTDSNADSTTDSNTDNYIDLKSFITPSVVNITSNSPVGFDSLNSGKAIRSVNPKDNMTLSEFFSLISNWFKTLDAEKKYKPRNVSGSSPYPSLFMANNTSDPAINSDSITKPALPMYDADMIENIGHRSRVLLSIEHNDANVTEGNHVVNDTSITKRTASGLTAKGYVNKSTILTTLETGVRSKVTTMKNDSRKKTTLKAVKDKKKKNKAIVKRSADDSNLIFWNDIYDDEYGIRTDNMDNYNTKDKDDNSIQLRDKHSVKEKDFLKRSGRWVQNKIKMFAKNLKINPHKDGVVNAHTVSMANAHLESMTVPSASSTEAMPRIRLANVPSVHTDNTGSKPRFPRSKKLFKAYAPDPGVPPHLSRDRVDYHVKKKETKDKEEIEEDYPEIDQKSLFAALTQNMKEVCKKAAKAVQETNNNIGNSPEIQLGKSAAAKEAAVNQGTVASVLMQQLVRLMTDLVDYQVQQKTCAKLPSELEQFLDWLINSKDDSSPDMDQPINQSKPLNEVHLDSMDELQAKQDAKPQFANGMDGLKKDQSADKMRYIECLDSVQDLITQYEDMTVDEKSKMSGVKPYLEKQMNYLNKQISAYDLFLFLENHDVTRNKRHGPKKEPKRQANLRRLFKSFVKKTKKTTTSDDKARNTKKMIKTTPDNHEGVTKAAVGTKELVKRNLKDVYYRAVAEAKKYSAMQNIHKKDDITNFETSTTRMKRLPQPFTSM